MARLSMRIAHAMTREERTVKVTRMPYNEAASGKGAIMAKKTAARKAGKARRARRDSSPKQRRGRAGGGGANDEVSNYRQKRRAQKIEAAEKKGGCMPKLGMLLLPFVAAGAYLLLRS